MTDTAEKDTQEGGESFDSPEFREQLRQAISSTSEALGAELDDDDKERVESFMVEVLSINVGQALVLNHLIGRQLASVFATDEVVEGEAEPTDEELTAIEAEAVTEGDEAPTTA